MDTQLINSHNLDQQLATLSETSRINEHQKLWLTTVAAKYWKRNLPQEDFQGNIEASWFKPGIQFKTLVLSPVFYQEIERIIDYFETHKEAKPLQKLSYQNLLLNLDHYSKKKKEKEIKKEGSVLLLENIYEGETYGLYEIKKTKALKLEAKEMSNCLDTYSHAVKKGEQKILSIRNAQGHSLVNISAAKDYYEDNFLVTEVREKTNLHFENHKTLTKHMLNALFRLKGRITGVDIVINHDLILFKNEEQTPSVPFFIPDGDYPVIMDINDLLKKKSGFDKINYSACREELTELVNTTPQKYPIKLIEQCTSVTLDNVAFKKILLSHLKHAHFKNYPSRIKIEDYDSSKINIENCEDVLLDVSCNSSHIEMLNSSMTINSCVNYSFIHPTCHCIDSRIEMHKSNPKNNHNLHGFGIFAVDSEHPYPKSIDINTHENRIFYDKKEIDYIDILAENGGMTSIINSIYGFKDAQTPHAIFNHQDFNIAGTKPLSHSMEDYVFHDINIKSIRIGSGIQEMTIDAIKRDVDIYIPATDKETLRSLAIDKMGFRRSIARELCSHASYQKRYNDYQRVEDVELDIDMDKLGDEDIDTVLEVFNDIFADINKNTVLSPQHIRNIEKFAKICFNHMHDDYFNDHRKSFNKHLMMAILASVDDFRDYQPIANREIIFEMMMNKHPHKAPKYSL